MSSNNKQNVQLKLKLIGDADAVGFVQDASRIAGITRIVQTFPDEQDPFLSSMYVAEVESQQVTAVMSSLKNDPRIEYVEPPAPRKLIR
jgi:hypothetical protein